MYSLPDLSCRWITLYAATGLVCLLAAAKRRVHRLVITLLIVMALYMLYDTVMSTRFLTKLPSIPVTEIFDHEEGREAGGLLLVLLGLFSVNIAPRTIKRNVTVESVAVLGAMGAILAAFLAPKFLEDYSSDGHCGGSLFEL